MSAPTRPAPRPIPMPLAAAMRLARLAMRRPAAFAVGPRVLAVLVDRIEELEREVVTRAYRDAEDARLRAHAIRVQQHAKRSDT